MRVHRIFPTILATVALTLGAGNAWAQTDPNEPKNRVAERERAFAKTMADRELEAFRGFVSEEAVFFGDGGVLRGRDAVAEGWSGFFSGPEAPFSWEPMEVEVLASGTLALSSGPVYNPQGERIGTFNSVWRLEADGHWRVVFDKGCPPCGKLTLGGGAGGGRYQLGVGISAAPVASTWGSCVGG